MKGRNTFEVHVFRISLRIFNYPTHILASVCPPMHRWDNTLKTDAIAQTRPSIHFGGLMQQSSSGTKKHGTAI
jgi:hypothetical protein